jgi:hypothetical protein
MKKISSVTSFGRDQGMALLEDLSDAVSNDLTVRSEKIVFGFSLSIKHGELTTLLLRGINLVNI